MDLGYDLKALAYPAPNPSVAEPVSPCLCSLVFLCDGGKLATLLLVVSMPTAHSTTDSSFVLQYDGDNLIPNNIKLRSSRGCLRREELQDVSSVAGDVKTLMLSTKQSCSVWCPATTPEFHPKQGSELALQRLVDLARATSVHIVFDFSQLHPPYKSTLKAFSKAARGLAGFPVEALLSKQGLRKASGEVFAPTEIAGAPPAYDAARTRKRPRKGEYPGALLSSSTDPRKVPARLARRPGAALPRRRRPDRTRPRRRYQSVPRPRLPHCDTRKSTTTPTSTSMRSWRTESLRILRSSTPRRPQPSTPLSPNVSTRISARRRMLSDSTPRYTDKLTQL